MQTFTIEERGPIKRALTLGLRCALHFIVCFISTLFLFGTLKNSVFYAAFFQKKKQKGKPY